MPLVDPLRLLAEIDREAIGPDPDMTVSQWADERRYLTRKDSAEEGPWRTSRTPYLREPMDAFSVSCPVQEIVMVFASQTGKSSAVNNCMGYAMDIVPGPALLVQPTEGMAKRYSKMRIQPMIEGTASLLAKVLPSRSRDSGNTLFQKEFINGAQMIIGGANSAASLASMPIRFAAEDEVDRFPLDVDEEGAPSDLVEARLRTFGDRKKRIKTSTPTLAGRSRIWWEWEKSDQRSYFLPCPHCGHYQVLTWDKLRYDTSDPMIPLGGLSRSPLMACEACGECFGEEAKVRWYEEDLGQWRPENPGSLIRGYHLPGFYAPLGWLSWTEIILGYERARGDDIKTKTFINTVLAECYAVPGEVPDWEAIYRRRETYPIGIVPDGAVVLTAFADVQLDRLEVEIVGWGENMESWSVDYIVIPGDTFTIQADDHVPCCWRELGRIFNASYRTAAGGEMRIERAGVDSGYNTQTVYAWVRSQHDPRIVATKGAESLGSLLGTPSTHEVTIRGKKISRGIRLWPIGVSIGKGEFYGWLRSDPPLDPADAVPRGFCHFPMYGQEHFLGLTAEELQQRLLRGFTKFEWVKIRQRNEQLDCRVGARAMVYSLGADRWDAGEWKRRRQLVAESILPSVVVEPPRRRGGRSREGFLGGDRRGWLGR